MRCVVIMMSKSLGICFMYRCTRNPALKKFDCLRQDFHDYTKRHRYTALLLTIWPARIRTALRTIHPRHKVESLNYVRRHSSHTVCIKT